MKFDKPVLIVIMVKNIILTINIDDKITRNTKNAATTRHRHQTGFEHVCA